MNGRKQIVYRLFTTEQSAAGRGRVSWRALRSAGRVVEVVGEVVRVRVRLRKGGGASAAVRRRSEAWAGVKLVVGVPSSRARRRT